MTYNVIIKVPTPPDQPDTFIKYHKVSNLVKLTSYLDLNHPSWSYFNVFDSKTKHQIASFTKNNRPKSAKVNY